MTEIAAIGEQPPSVPRTHLDSAGRPTAPGFSSWLPSWALITTKHLEIRKRRGLMVALVVLILAAPVLVLGLRLLFHAIDPKSYGPAGSPGIFAILCNVMAEFGFIAAAALGATAGTTDLTDGVFRHLVVTGRSRVALYLARIPAGLAIVLPLVALAFTMVCLVTSYAGTPQGTSVNFNSVSIPVQLDQAQLETWLLERPAEAQAAFANGPGPASAGVQLVRHQISSIYGDYVDAEPGVLNPASNVMAKIGGWLELEVGVGFVVGLGVGSLFGQRTVTIILMIALEIIVTPILASHVIPYFLDGQRIDVGVALDQLRPAGLVGAGGGGGGGPGAVLVGGRGVLAIPPMAAWAMITVIVGWIVGWSMIGAWRMATRDA
jgi:hypothetical protein